MPANAVSRRDMGATLYGINDLHPRFPFHLELEVKVRLVKVMHTCITVLSSTAVHCAGGTDGDVVERTEMASDTANLLLEDLVVEAGLELSLSCRSCRHVHGGLTTSEDDIVFDRGDGGAVERSVGDVRLEDLEVLCGEEL